MAVLVDGVLLGILYFIIRSVTGTQLESDPIQWLTADAHTGSNLLLLGLTVVYIWLFLSRNKGQTPGKKMLGVRVVKADGSQLGDNDALMRAVVSMVGGVVFLLSYLWAFIDDRNQTWHDKAAGTLVVKA